VLSPSCCCQDSPSQNDGRSKDVCERDWLSFTQRVFIIESSHPPHFLAIEPSIDPYCISICLRKSAEFYMTGKLEEITVTKRGCRQDMLPNDAFDFHISMHQTLHQARHFPFKGINVWTVESAPCSRSKRATSSCPSQDAACNGVDPSLS
jgi:hypothetical protein